MQLKNLKRLNYFIKNSNNSNFDESKNTTALQKENFISKIFIKLFIYSLNNKYNFLVEQNSRIILLCYS